MKNQNLKTKIKSGHIVYSVGIKSSTQFSRTIIAEIYLIRKIKNKYWYYFTYLGKTYKVDELGLQFSFNVGEKVKLLYRGKKVDVIINAQLKPNSNGIKGLGYIVSLKNKPSIQLLTSEKWIFPYSY